MVSKLSPTTYCSVAIKSGSVYQTPPPFAESIKLAVVPVPKDPVFHEVTKVPSSVYNQEHPLDVMFAKLGCLLYRWVPFYQDWDRGNNSKVSVFGKVLLNSVLKIFILEENTPDTLSFNTDLISSSLNWTKNLEG